MLPWGVEQVLCQGEVGRWGDMGALLWALMFGPWWVCLRTLHWEEKNSYVLNHRWKPSGSPWLMFYLIQGVWLGCSQHLFGAEPRPGERSAFVCPHGSDFGELNLGEPESAAKLIPDMGERKGKGKGEGRKERRRGKGKEEMLLSSRKWKGKRYFNII